MNGWTKGEDALISRKIISRVMISVVVGCLVMVVPALGATSLDESNIESVVKHFYRPGGKKKVYRSFSYLSPSESYRFLSAKSKAQINKDKWKKYENEYMGSNNPIITSTSVTVLKEKEFKGREFAIVSVVNNIEGQDFTNTFSWTIESGKWKLLSFFIYEEKCGQAWNVQKNDKAVFSVAADWSDADPYSTGWRQCTGMAVITLWTDKALRNDFLDRLVRELIEINQDDTVVIADAVQWSSSPAIAEEYLKKLDNPEYRKTVIELRNILHGKGK